MKAVRINDDKKEVDDNKDELSGFNNDDSGIYLNYKELNILY